MKSWRSLTAWLHPTRRATLKDSPTRETLPEAGGRSLRLRLLITVIIALTPAAIVSIVQGADRVQRDVANVRDRLIQTAHAAAADEEGIFTSAEQVLKSLANQPEVRQAASDCGTSLQNALKDLNYFTNIAKVSARGEVLCAAILPPLEQRDLVDQPWWADAAKRNGFFIAPMLNHHAGHPDVVAGVLPLKSQEAAFDGVLAVTVDMSRLDATLAQRPLSGDAVTAVFDSSGEMIASNARDIAIKVFSDRPSALEGTSGLISASGPNGEHWSYAVTPLLGNNGSIAFAERDNVLFAGTYLHVATDLLLPVLMLGLASAAIWIATDRQVIRWIVYLRRIATAYARGHYAIRPVALEEAPSEFRTLGETFSKMAAAVQDRDSSLREALAQKSLMIKETHHRVKNNLQIVMSLLSLQAAKLRDPAAQNALRQAQVRVNALALVHRILHEIEDLGAVDLKHLIHDLAYQIQEGFGAERRDLHLDLEITPRHAPTDLAVPLTLFTVEALTNAFKHAYPVGARGGTIQVRLVPVEGGKLRLTIEDDGMGVARDTNGTNSGIGSRLIQGFAQQVGGTLNITAREGGGTIVSLEFPDPSFNPEALEPLSA